MEFSLDKIPIKYIIGSYLDTEDFPTSQDILYVMTKRAVDKNKSIAPVSFSESVVIKKIGEEHKEKIIKSLSALEQEEIIQGKETKAGKTFKILKNPFL